MKDANIVKWYQYYKDEMETLSYEVKIMDGKFFISQHRNNKFLSDQDNVIECKTLVDLSSCCISLAWAQGVELK